jgi:hypothetical protein
MSAAAQVCNPANTLAEGRPSILDHASATTAAAIVVVVVVVAAVLERPSTRGARLALQARAGPAGQRLVHYDGPGTLGDGGATGRRGCRDQWRRRCGCRRAKQAELGEHAVVGLNVAQPHELIVVLG